MDLPKRILLLALLLGGCTDSKPGDDRSDGAEPECVEGTSTPCPNQMGSCAGGVRECGGGRLGPCSKAPATQDTCDAGNDDSCNGVPNEGCKCINGTTIPCDNQKGVCAGSTKPCVNGVADEKNCSVRPDDTWHKMPVKPGGSWDWNCNGVEEKEIAVNGAWPNCRWTANPGDMNCCGAGCIPPSGAAAVVCGPSADPCKPISKCGDLILFNPAFCSSCGAPHPPGPNTTQGCK